MPSPSDDFDAILAEPGPSASVSAPAAAASSAPEVDAHTAHLGAPSLGEFLESWDLYRDPVLAGVFAGLALGMIGVFIVLRRAVFVTAAVSQAAGLGVACAFLFSIHAEVEISPVLLAFLFAAAAALIVALRPPVRLPKEVVVGFVYLAGSALAIIVGDRISQEAHDIASILFGTAVLVRPLDLWLLVSVGSAASLCVALSARGLAFAGFDPDAARVQALPVSLLEGGLWLSVAAVVAVATRALGALPVFAFAVLPALGALSLARRLPQALLLGALGGALAGGTGYVAAFLFELPVGAAQATVAGLFALVALGLGRVRR
jgi:zinc transport system permease protein